MKPQTKPTHTPTPWKAILNDSGKTNQELIEIRIPEEFGRIVAFVPWPNKADAAFVVRAVNSHEILTKVLYSLIKDNEAGNLPLPSWAIADIYQAIAQAEGKE